jgi:hypothetical protein
VKVFSFFCSTSVQETPPGVFLNHESSIRLSTIDDITFTRDTGVDSGEYLDQGNLQ